MVVLGLNIWPNISIVLNATQYLMPNSLVVREKVNGMNQTEWCNLCSVIIVYFISFLYSSTAFSMFNFQMRVNMLKAVLEYRNVDGSLSFEVARTLNHTGPTAL
jgi:hypothetical protein